MTSSPTTQMLDKNNTSERVLRESHEHQRKIIYEIYGESSQEAIAKRDQALAKLYYDSGCTYHELAKIEKKSIGWINQWLRFGRFLNSPTVMETSAPTTSKLTENKFHLCWKRTDETESDEYTQFKQVIQLIKQGEILGRSPRGLQSRIIDKFADAKYHPLSVIVAGIGEPKYEPQISHILDLLVKNNNPKIKCERKKVGKTWSYRIFLSEKTVGTVELTEKLTPITKEMQIMCRRAPGTISNTSLGHLATQIENFLEKWCE